MRCLQNDLAVELGGRNVAAMICRLSGLTLRSALVAALALGCAQANAQDKLDSLKQHDQELQAARDAQKKSIETEVALKREIDQIGADRKKLNLDLIDTAARLRS